MYLALQSVQPIILFHILSLLVVVELVLDLVVVVPVVVPWCTFRY